MKALHSSTRATDGGFQLKELVILVAVVALLAVVQSPSLADNRNSSLADQCRANMRRLAQAWLMYADDNDGRLVPNNGNTGGSRQTWATGWLTLNAGSSDNTNATFLVEPGPTGMSGLLGPYLQRDASVFRCPADASTTFIAGRHYNRVRSVSMNNWMGGDAYCGGNGGNLYRNYRTLSEITAPAMRWVIVEERPDSIGDSWHAVRLGDKVGGWWLVNYPGNFHSGGAWLTHTDGHVEFRRWTDRRMVPPLANRNIPLQIPMDPANADMAWLQERTSELR